MKWDFHLKYQQSNIYLLTPSGAVRLNLNHLFTRLSQLMLSHTESWCAAANSGWHNQKPSCVQVFLHQVTSATVSTGLKSPLVSTSRAGSWISTITSRNHLWKREKLSAAKLLEQHFPISPSCDEPHTCITSFTTWSLQQHWLLQPPAISYLQSARTLYNNENTGACLEFTVEVYKEWQGGYGCTNQIWIKCTNSALTQCIFHDSFGVSSQLRSPSFKANTVHADTDVHLFRMCVQGITSSCPLVMTGRKTECLSKNLSDQWHTENRLIVLLITGRKTTTQWSNLSQNF